MSVPNTGGHVYPVRGEGAAASIEAFGCDGVSVGGAVGGCGAGMF